MTSTLFTTSTYLLLAKSFIHSFNHLTKASIYIHIITSILIFTWLPTSCFVVRSGNFHVEENSVSAMYLLFTQFSSLFRLYLFLALCFIFLFQSCASSFFFSSTFYSYSFLLKAPRFLHYQHVFYLNPPHPLP